MFIWVYSKRIRPDSKFLYLAALPIFGGIFDYVENILIIRMIVTFPEVSEGLVAVASGFTLLKSAFSTASFLLLVLGFLFLLKKTSKGSPQKETESESKGQQGWDDACYDHIHWHRLNLTISNEDEDPTI